MSREIDAEIAEKVMGWKWQRRIHDTSVWCFPPDRPLLAKDRGGNSFWRDDPVGDFEFVERPKKVHNIDWLYPLLPRYSTDIAAAWQVVEKLRAEGLHVAINTAGRRWYASFAGGSETDEGGALWGDWGDTPAEAICKAALAALSPRGGKGVDSGR